MALQYDWGLDDNGDLDIESNDFTYVLSDQQHIQDTILAAPLWWKQFPGDGVAIRSYLGSSGMAQKLMGIVKQQLQSDGYSCTNPVVTQSTNGTFSITPNAIRL